MAEPSTTGTTQSATDSAPPSAAELAASRYKILVRAIILGGLVAAFLLVDGLILLFTNGLNSDAQPIFPWLGGVWANKNRSSGTGMLVIAALLVAVLVGGWFAVGRRLRAQARAGDPARGR